MLRKLYLFAYSAAATGALAVAGFQTKGAWLVYTSLLATAGLAAAAVWLRRAEGDTAYRTVVSAAALTGLLLYAFTVVAGPSLGMMEIGVAGHAWRLAFALAVSGGAGLMACGVAALAGSRGATHAAA